MYTAKNGTIKIFAVCIFDKYTAKIFAVCILKFHGIVKQLDGFRGSDGC
jgi:hypothetical protein